LLLIRNYFERFGFVMHGILLALAFIIPQPDRAPIDSYVGPPWPIELGPPSYGQPIHFAPDGARPLVQPRGYKWFRYDVNTVPIPAYRWCLHRMTDAPPNDDAVLSRLPKDPNSPIWEGPKE
jgi:hypothetical protein